MKENITNAATFWEETGVDLQSWSEIMVKTAKNGVVCVATLLKDHLKGFKRFLLYILGELILRILGLSRVTIIMRMAE